MKSCREELILGELLHMIKPGNSNIPDDGWKQRFQMLGADGPLL